MASNIGVWITCKRCKGTGLVRDINWFSGVLTLGLTALIEASIPDTCPKCDGKGEYFRYNDGE